MSDLFRRGDGFEGVLKQIDEVFHDDIANLCAEQHFSWTPVSSTSKSGE